MQFLKTNISQDSVAIPLGVMGSVMIFLLQIPAERKSERIIRSINMVT